MEKYILSHEYLIRVRALLYNGFVLRVCKTTISKACEIHSFFVICWKIASST